MQVIDDLTGKAKVLIYALLLSTSCLLFGCSQTQSNEPVFYEDENPLELSEWNILSVDKNNLTLNKRVVPYDLNSSLFTDYAHKLRTVWVPTGTEVNYKENEAFELPVGSIISKTFYYPTLEKNTVHNTSVLKSEDSSSKRLLSDNKNVYTLDINNIKLIETRLLVRRQDAWVALPYIWNDEQTEAILKRAGDIKTLELQYRDANSIAKSTSFNYIVPDANQCAGCHATNASTRQLSPIGIKARHLNKPYPYKDGVVNQLDAWTEKRLLYGVPELNSVSQNAVWSNTSLTVEQRARAYLDINCSHCHNKVGPADTSGLLLEPDAPHGASLGVCKLPIAAGTGTGDREFGIVPGKPDESIMLFRMESTNPAVMMPELGRSLAHAEGVALIAEWIRAIEGDCE